MTTTIVPYDEIEHLLKLILESYQARNGVRLLRSQLDYELITPREGMKLGIQIKSKPPAVNRLIRVYVSFYEFEKHIEISDFIQEELQTGSGTQDQAEVAIAVFPRGVFPVISNMGSLSIAPGTPTYIDALSVGFNPDEYVSFSGNYIDTFEYLSGVSPDDIQVRYRTQDGTALSDINYGTVDASETWLAGETGKRTSRISLLGDIRFFEWFSGTYFQNAVTWEGGIEISDSNCRIYSPPDTFYSSMREGEPELISLYGQEINLSSQYLPTEECYYEVLVDKIAASFALSLGSSYYVVDGGASGYLFWGGGLANVLVLISYESGQFIQLKFRASFPSGNGVVIHEYTIGAVNSLPLRLHFIASEEGFKVGANGNWFHYLNHGTENSAFDVPWLDAVYSKDDPVKYQDGFEDAGVTLRTVAPRKYAFQLSAGKNPSHGEMDVRFIVNPNDQMYRPNGVAPYTGVVHQTTNRSFTTVLEDPVNVTIGNNPATIFLDSISRYSFQKLVTNQNRDGIQKQPVVNMSRAGDYHGARVEMAQPLVQWSKIGLGAGIFFDMTELQLAEKYSTSGGIFYPDMFYSDKYRMSNNQLLLNDFYIDFLDLPMDRQSGLCMILTYRDQIPHFVSRGPFYRTLIPGQDFGEEENTPFLNGSFKDNGDGTFSFMTMLRFFQSAQKLVLAAVPFDSQYGSNSLPPLLLEFVNSPAEVMLDLVTQDGSNYIYFSTPIVPQPNGYYNEAAVGGDMKLYYTTDGSEPVIAPESNYVTLDSEGCELVIYEGGFMKHAIFRISVYGGNVYPTSVVVKAFVVRSGWLRSPTITRTFRYSNVYSGTVMMPMVRAGKLDASGYLPHAEYLAQQTYYDGQNYHEEFDPYTNAIRFYHRGDGDQYKKLGFSVDVTVPVGRDYIVEYMVYNIQDNFETQPLYSWREAEFVEQEVVSGSPVKLFCIPDRVFPSPEILKRYAQFNVSRGLGVWFRLVTADEVPAYPGYSVLPIRYEYLMLMYEHRFLGQGSVTYDQGSGIACLYKSYVPSSPSDEAQYVACIRGDLFALVYDDLRYYEFKIKRLVGTDNPLYLRIGNTKFEQDGTLTDYQDQTTATARPWGETDVIRVRLNLRNRGFAVAINDGDWYEDNMSPTRTSSPMSNSGWYTKDLASVVMPNPGGTDLIGTEAILRTRASQFEYPIPTGYEPLDNLHD